MDLEATEEESSTPDRGPSNSPRFDSLNNEVTESDFITFTSNSSSDDSFDPKSVSDDSDNDMDTLLKSASISDKETQDEPSINYEILTENSAKYFYHGLLQLRFNFSENEIVENVANGTLLKGIRVPDLSGLRTGRNVVIQLKNKIKFSSPWKVSYKVFEEFTSQKEIDEFQSRMKKYGLQTTCNWQYLPQDTWTVIKSCKCSECCCCGKKKAQYEYLASFKSISVASWQPNLSDFTLCKDALAALSRIEKCLLSKNISEAESLTERFFSAFGTHIVLGLVHFGRIEVQRENNAPCFCFTQMESICHELTKRHHYRYRYNGGGHLFEEDIGSDCHNYEWIITEREILKKKNFVGLWKFIWENETFENPAHLGEFVRQQAVKEETEIDFQKYEKRMLHVAVHSLNDQILSINNSTMNISALKHVAQEVFRLENKTVFHELLNNCECFAQFLLRITEGTASKENEVEAQRLIKNLLLESRDIFFRHKKEIEAWVNKDLPQEEENYPDIFIVDLSQLMFLIDQGEFLNLAERRSDKNKSVPVHMTNIFTKTVNTFLHELQSRQCHAEYIFLLATLISFGYDFRECVFSRHMKQETLVKFSSDFKTSIEEFQKYGDYSIPQQHAWVMKFLVTKLIENKVSDSLDTSELPEEFSKNEIRLDGDVLDVIRREKTLKAINSSLSKRLHDIGKGQVLCWKDLREKLILNMYSERHKTENSFHLEDDLDTKSDFFYAMETLGIAKYFPEKMSIHDVLDIKERRFTDGEKIKDIPWHMLHHVISCDLKFLEKSYAHEIPIWPKKEETQMEEEEEAIQEEDEEDDTNDLTIHPLDSFCVLLFCCDIFLRGLLYRKLASLKISIPFIYSDNRQRFCCSLLPLKNIYIDDKAESVAAKRMKIVSFVRIGDINFRSKSETINKLLTDGHFPHLPHYHRNCKFGDSERKLYNGTIEVAWKMSRQQELNDEEFAVLNLRGDAIQFRQQLEMLMSISNTVIIFIEFGTIEREKTMISQLQKYKSVIVVTEQKRKGTGRSVLDTNNWNTICTKQTNGRQKNEASFKSDLLRNILKSLKTDKEIISLEIAIQRLSKEGLVLLDEDREDFSHGISAARSFVSQMGVLSSEINARDTLLPLQGTKYLHLWSSVHRKLRQMDPSQSHNSRREMEEELSNIRVQQAKCCISGMQIMSSFISTLIINVNNVKTIEIFLCKVEELLEQKSRAILPEVTNEVVEAYRLEEEGTENIETEKALANLKNANISLLHFFREIGQIFESIHHCKNFRELRIEHSTNFAVNFLPRIVAQLLILGRSFEIMNGEAVDISLNWIQSVFTELNSIKRDKKVYSVSVLGVQSSGKSTLLNAMFGLEFPVSSGKCTKGINLHLLPVTRHDLPFDSVFVFDTEGLRSSTEKTRSFNQDNKLATFAIGIADLVILNVKGENIFDIENTLEIVVHALLRLKQANDKISLRQSCVFVHQNVSIIEKGYNLKADIERTRRDLNTITVNIAKHEHMDSITSFNDVIAFNTNEDVVYVPNLWHGEPPIAPISEAYSREVMNIGRHILERSKTFKNFYTISQTFERIKCMWDGIVSEDFVFSFQNILQMKAYNLLQETTNRLSWELEKYSNKFWRKNVTKTLYHCSPEKMEITESKLDFRFCAELDGLASDIKMKLERFFNSSDLKTEMIHWHCSKVKYIEDKVQMIKMEFKRKLTKHAMHRRIKYDNADKETEEKILKMTAENAKRIQKKNLSPDEEEKKFNDMWLAILSDLVPDLPYETENQEIALKRGIYEVLDLAYREHTVLLKQEWEIGFDNTCTYGSSGELLMKKPDIDEKYINIKKKNRHPKKSSSLKKYQSIAMEKTNSIYEEVERYFSREENSGAEYNKTDFQCVLKIVTDAFSDHHLKDKKFSLTPEYQIKIAVHVAAISFARFAAMNKEFEKEHNLFVFVSSKKQQSKELFLNIIKREKESVILSNYLCNELKKQIEENVITSVSDILKESMLERYSFLKCNLVNAILKHLAENDCFSTYLLYLEYPREYAKNWVKEHILEESCTKCDLKQSIFSKLALRILSTEISSISDSAKEVPKTNILNWIDTFRENLDELGYKLDVGYRSLISEKDEGLNSFYLTFLKQINEIEREFQHTFSYLANTDIKERLKNIDINDIFEKLWGCSEHCPLCLEPCEKTTKDHFREDKIPHSCIQHRPFAVKGICFHSSNQMFTKTCNYLVRSDVTLGCGKWCGCPDDSCTINHPLRKYKKWIPNWDITKYDLCGSKYWIWFTAKYGSDLCEYLETDTALIPSSWSEITVCEAIQSLSPSYIQMPPERKPSLWERLKKLFGFK